MHDPAFYSEYMQNDSIPHEPILAFWRDGKLPTLIEPEEDGEEISLDETSYEEHDSYHQHV